MRNNTCIVCSKEFEPREGKLYCSNACKQKAFSDRQQQIGEAEEKEQEQKLIQKQLALNFIEYQEYEKKYKDSIGNFQLYCFFRKNLSGNPSIVEIHDYIESFGESWWDNFWNKENSPAQKKYREFEAKFFSDEVTIYFSRNDNINKPEV